MKPHIEEAWRALRFADRDVQAFHSLARDPDVHMSTVCFHAQQAVEKALKAVLFARRVEFRRTHDLVELAALLLNNGIATPVADDTLLQLNPFAVTLRCDDVEGCTTTRQDAAEWVKLTRDWAEQEVGAAALGEQDDVTGRG